MTTRTRELPAAARALAEAVQAGTWDNLHGLADDVLQALALPDPSAEIPAPHHRTGTDTEQEAARLMTPRAGTLREEALRAFTDALDTGLTDRELARVTGRYLYSIAPRRVELTRQGWLVDSGQRRRTDRGSRAVVWKLSDAALSLLNLTTPASAGVTATTEG